MHGKTEMAAASDPPLTMLDLGPSVQHLVLELLDAADLCRIGATCTALHQRCMGDAALWRTHCERLLGRDTAALHSIAAPTGARSAAPATAQSTGNDGAATAESSEQRSGGLSRGSTDGGEGRFWARLYRSGTEMDGCYYLQGASDRFATTIPEDLVDKLARAGHTATPAGGKLVVAGGILRSGALTMDALVIDPARLTISRPQELGQAPETRFRHSAVVAALPLASPLHDAVATQLSDLGVAEAPGSGTLILLWAGYNTMGVEFGGSNIQGLWVAEGAKTVAWLSLSTTGDAPSKRFHHTADAFDGGRQMVVLGGEGRDVHDACTAGSPVVYVLDVPYLAWTCNTTTSEAEDASPGACALHFTTVRTCPGTGYEELVVIKGSDPDAPSSTSGMLPFVLDLETYMWRRGPWRDSAWHVAMPAPRQRPGTTQVAGKWLLVAEGTPVPLGVGSCFKDIQRLHLPTLSWRGPVPVHPASAKVERTAGFSAAGLVFFGGIMISKAGVAPMTRHDVLLLGPPGELRQQLPAKAAQAPAEQPTAAAPGSGNTHNSLADTQLSLAAVSGLQKVLQQVLEVCRKPAAVPDCICCQCGHPGMHGTAAPLMVAGILVAYAAQFRAKDDFAPVWPQAFPEHLRTGGGNMPQAKAQELATPAPSAALGLAWFRGVRAGKDDPDSQALEKQAAVHSAAVTAAAAEALATASAESPAAAAGVQNAAPVAPPKLAQQQGQPQQAPAGPPAAVEVEQELDASPVPTNSALLPVPATPLGLPPLPARQPASTEPESLLSTGEATDTVTFEDTASWPGAFDAADASASSQAASQATSAPAAAAADAVAVDAVAPAKPQSLASAAPATATNASVRQLGRQLHQLSVSGQHLPHAPPAAGAPPPQLPKKPYPKQPSMQTALPHAYNAMHQGFQPMLQGYAPPEGSEEYHRMVALQASLARWQHPGATVWSAEAAAAWARSGYQMPAVVPPPGMFPGYHQHGQQAPTSPHAYVPVPPPPPQQQHGQQGSGVFGSRGPGQPAPPMPPAHQQSGGWAWAHWQSGNGHQGANGRGAVQPPPPPPPQRQQAPQWQPAGAPQPPPPLQHGGPGAAWRAGQVGKGPPPPPPPPRFPPPQQHPLQQQAALPAAMPHPQYGTMYGPAVVGIGMDGTMLMSPPVRSGQPRRSRGGQRRRKAAAAAAAAVAAAAAASGGQDAAMAPHAEAQKASAVVED